MIKKSLWRYERKFVVPDHDVQDVALSLLLHPLKFSEIYWQRRVNSFYLDSEDLDFAFENYEGSPAKTKVRVRWYDELLGKIHNPTIEIKAKVGSVGKKVSLAFPEFTNVDISKGLSEVDFRKLVLNSSLPEEYKTRLSLLKPSVITSYERRYFQTFDKLFRATIDFDVSFYGSYPLMHFVPQDIKEGLILEIKYDVEHDIMAQQVLHKLPFRLGKYSKYATGIGELWTH